MKTTFVTFMCAFAVSAFAATPESPRACDNAPQLVQTPGKNVWTFAERDIRIDKDCLAKNGKPANGILWLDFPVFSDGSIELDIKGKDEQGKSVVGVAFHGTDETHFDAVYFRPFNFRNLERRNRSIQYISLPKYEWFTLREQFPGKYENAPNAALDPNDWFRVRIEVKFPEVKVFVNGSAEPSLAIAQLSSAKGGRIGLWTGNNEGHFRNLTISRP